MMRIIDLECSLPRRETDPPESAPTEAAAPYADHTAQHPGYGMANYGRIFRSRAEGDNRGPAMPMDAYMDKLASVGIEKAIPFGASNEETRELLRAYPDRFLGLARLSPTDVMSTVRELERLVREEGFHALGVSALVDRLPASDRRYYPLYAKAVELGIPARIYSTMNYATDRPYDLGHPRNLDQIAMDFPELTIIGGLGGWPWVNDMVALVRRHPNLYLDTSAHRPTYFAQPGSGWEMLMQFGNTLIQDKVMVGLSVALIGQSHETLIQEYLDLPLKDSVKEKWLYGNAARVFGLA
jgi:hypothetical protein